MERDSRTRRRFLAAVGTAVAGGIAGCSAERPRETDDAGADGTGSVDTPTQGEGNAITQVYRDTIDSVVLVQVFTDVGSTGQGSGWVFDDGRIVTNQHVVREEREHVEVRFGNGEWRDGEVLGTDVYSDLAVLEVDDRPEAAAPLDLVDGDPPIGTQVVALGNPFGFGESVSSGIVSGIDRALPGANDFVIPDAIQTDAAVNPGNSGGPLVTLDGDVVGVINSGGGDNIGFAISAALVRQVIPALVEDGSFSHPYMGVRLLTVTPTIADANGLDEADGVLIVSVIDGGPSDGVLQGSPENEVVYNREVPVGGDVILSMDGEPIGSQPDLANFLALQTRPGDTIPIEVIRDGERETVDLTLGTRPEP